MDAMGRALRYWPTWVEIATEATAVAEAEMRAEFDALDIPF